MPKRWIAICIIAVSAIGASIEAWNVTRPLIGISPDSVVYMASARNIVAGRGISMPAANGQNVPMTHFPPGYPLALASAGYFFQHNLFSTARALNILLFGLNVALLIGWVYKRTQILSLTAFAAVINLSAIDFLRVYSMAWSEPLFLFFTFAGLFFLDLYLERPAPMRLGLAALFSAAAVLTRYAGIASVVSGVALLLIGTGRSRRQKIIDAAVFGVFAGMPIALWLLRNLILTHDATTRKLVFHPVMDQIRAAICSTMSLWLFQGSVMPSVAFGISVGLAVLLVLLWQRYKRMSFFAPPLLTPLIFSASYALLLAVIILFFEAQLLVPDEYDRILCPLHIAVGLTTLTALSMCAWPLILRRLGMVGAIVMGLFFSFAGVTHIRALSQDGQQFSSVQWRTSPLIEYVRHLSPDMHVYTNGRMPIYLYADRSCFEIPPKTLLSTLEPNPNYQKTMARIQAEVEAGIAVVVCFSIENLPQFPSLQEWETRLHRKPRTMPDGVIFA